MTVAYTKRLLQERMLVNMRAIILQLISVNISHLTPMILVGYMRPTMLLIMKQHTLQNIVENMKNPLMVYMKELNMRLDMIPNIRASFTKQNIQQTLRETYIHMSIRFQTMHLNMIQTIPLNIVRT